jgi:hypothetical protein
MNDLSAHLSADELDALQFGSGGDRAMSHVETCADCRVLVGRDARVLALLAALPAWEPRPGFAERIIAGLDRSVMVQLPASASGETDRSRSARRRVLIGGLVTGGIVAGGFAWAAANPGAALGLATPALQDVGQTLWLSLRGVTANALEQPWFGTVRDTLASPTRIVPALVIVGTAYLAALVGLRRLLTRPAADAGW